MEPWNVMYYVCSKAKYKLITSYFYICIWKYKNINLKMIYIYIYIFIYLFIYFLFSFLLFFSTPYLLSFSFVDKNERCFILFYWIEKACYFFRPLTRRHKSTKVFKENNGIGPINWTYDRREKLKLTKEKKNKKKHEHGFQAASRILKRKKRERKIILITYSFN